MTTSRIVVPNAGTEMPVPRKFCEPEMPGPRTPSAKPWSASGSVGTGGMVFVILLPCCLPKPLPCCLLFKLPVTVFDIRPSGRPASLAAFGLRDRLAFDL